MGSDVAFTVSEIGGAVLSIQLPSDKDSTLESIVQTLRTGKFATTKAYVADFPSNIDNMLSKLTFVGPGFAFGLVKTKLVAQFLHDVEFVHPNLDMQSDDPTKILSDENLKMMSSDFNYILGLTLGKMSLNNNNLKFFFTIQMSKEVSTILSLNHLFSPKSKTVFGNIADLQMNGIKIKMTENVLGTEGQSDYHIYESGNMTRSKNYHNIRAEFRFRSSGPVDFSKLVKKSTNRMNELVKSIVRDVHES